MPGIKNHLITFLRWTERYTKTDMTYLASGGFWLFLGQASSILTSLAVAIAFGHLASQDLYGNYKYALSLAGLFAAFSLSGIGTAVTQSTAKGNEGSLKQGTWLSLKWSWGTVLLCAGAAIYYWFAQGNAFLGVALCIAAIASPFLNAFPLFTSYLTGKKLFAKETRYYFLNSLFPTLAVIATLFFTERAIIVLVVYFGSNALFDFVFWLITVRQTRNDTRDPELLSYGANLSVMSVVNAIANKIDSIAVFAFMGPADLAIYTFAIALPDQIKASVKFISPLSLAKFAKRTLDEIETSIGYRIATLALGTSVIAVIYIWLAPWVFHFFFPVYAASISYSQWYAASVVFTAVTLPLTTIFSAHKATRALYVSTAGSSIFYTIILLILVYKYGLVGAIISKILYRAFNAVLAYTEYRRLIRTVAVISA